MVKMVQLMDYVVHDGHSREYAQVPIRDKHTQPKPVVQRPTTQFRPRIIDLAGLWTYWYDEQMSGRSPSEDVRKSLMERPSEKSKWIGA